MCVMKETCPDFARGVVAGSKSRGVLIEHMVKACEELGYDVEALTDRCIYPSGVAASAKALGDDPDDFIRFMTAINVDVFDKEVIQLDPEHSVARFHFCPLYAAWKEMGLPPERISYLCDLASKADYGRASNFENVELTFPKRLADGDAYCELDAKRKHA